MNIKEFEDKVESIVGQKVDFNVFYSMYIFEFHKGKLRLANRKNGGLIHLLDDEESILLKKEYLREIGAEETPKVELNFFGKLQNGLFMKRKKKIDAQNLILYKSLSDKFIITDSNGEQLDLDNSEDLPSFVEMSWKDLEISVVTSQELSQVIILSKYKMKEDLHLKAEVVIKTLHLENNIDSSKETYKSRFLKAVNLLNEDVVEHYKKIITFADKTGIVLSDINLNNYSCYDCLSLDIKNKRELGFKDIQLLIEKENIYLYNSENGCSEKMTLNTSKETFNKILEDFKAKYVQALCLMKDLKEKQSRIGEMTDER